MNLRGMAAYVNYSTQIENNQSIADDLEEDSKTYTSTNSAEENENQGSNIYETLEKLNNHVRYSFKFNETENDKLEHIYYHTDIYSLIKPSLNTPPPELG